MKSTKGLIILMLSLFLLFGALMDGISATYYFSTGDGQDSRSAAMARSPKTPWKSIDKLNDIMGTLSPGDSVLFKSGETFFGTIEIRRSGNASSPIFFGAYGSGSKPIITSLSPLRDWKPSGNGVLKAEVPNAPGEVSIVLLSGEPLEMGRFPNSNDVNKGYLEIERVGDSRNISSSKLSSGSSFSGGEVVIRKNNWVIDRHEIVSHNAGNVTFDASNSNYRARVGYGFFIQNHPNTLDQNGEWYYNNKTGEMYIFHTGGVQSLSNVKAATRNSLLIAHDIKNIRIAHLAFMGANGEMLELQNTENFFIEDCEFSFSGKHHLMAKLTKNLQITNSSLKHGYNGGVAMHWENDQTTIANNFIESTFLFPGMGLNGDLNGNAIFMSDLSHNGNISNNKILNSGYQAVYFNGNNTEVRNNFIDTFAFVKDDGAGIYTYTGNSNRNYSGRKVVGNIIKNGVGAIKGSKLFYAEQDHGYAEGIYLDDNSSGVEVNGNTIAHMTHSGIYIHNGRNITVSNNNIIDTRQSMLFVNDHMGEDIRNLSVENNQFFAFNSLQRHLYFQSHKEDVGSMATFHHNFYVKPVGSPFTFIYQSINDGWREFPMDYPSWKEKYQVEHGGVFTDLDFKGYEVVNRTENHIIKHDGFEERPEGSYSWAPDGQTKSSLETNRESGKSAIMFEFKAPGISAFPVKEVREGHNYEFELEGNSDKPQFIQIYLRQAEAPYERLSNAKTVQLNEKINQFTGLLKANRTAGNAILVIEPLDNNASFKIIQLAVEHVEVEELKLENHVRLVYNDSRSKQNQPLGGFYQKLGGGEEFDQIRLEPFSSEILVLSRLKESESQHLEEGAGLLPEISFYSHIEPGLIRAGEKLELSIDAISLDSDISHVSVYRNETLIGESDLVPFFLTLDELEPGNYTFKAKATDIKDRVNVSDPLVFTVAESEPKKGDYSGTKENKSKGSLFMNIGSPQNGYFDSRPFVAEEGAVILNQSARLYSNLNASKEKIFQSERFGANMRFAFPVENGVYTLKTYHNELYFGKVEGVSANVGTRVFSIFIEGEEKKSNIDLFMDSKNNELVLSFENIEVKDGILNLDLTSSANNATLSAVELIPVEAGIDTPKAKEVSTVNNILAYNLGSDRDVVFQNLSFLAENPERRTSISGRIYSNPEASTVELFQNEIFGRNVSYAFPVPNGTYTVQTFHNELYFGKIFGESLSNQRVFSIAIEGNVVKDKLDLYKESGNTETILTFENVLVTDGVLNLDLTAFQNNATISGIAVYSDDPNVVKQVNPSPGRTSYFINAGSQRQVEFKDHTFSPDQELNFHSSDSRTYSRASSGVPPLFTTHRFGRDFEYQIPLEEGLYTIVTHHHENYFGEVLSPAVAGQRVFSVYLEGVLVRENLDLFVENQNRPLSLTFADVLVKDGILNMRFEALSNNALVSGIEIIPQEINKSQMRKIIDNESMEIKVQQDNEVVSELQFQKQDVSTLIYPNPAKDRLFLEVGRGLEVKWMGVYDVNNLLIKDFSDPGSFKHGEGMYHIDLPMLKTGLYFLVFSDLQGIVKRLKFIKN